MTSYMHKTRCGDGSNATYTNAPSGTSFKVCNKTDESFTQLAAYQLPPFLCKQACDEDPRCMFYSVDSAGGCWTSAPTTGTSRVMHYRIVV